MKLLFDQNLSFRLCRALHDLFPGSTQAKLLGMEAADDEQLWAYAKAHGLTLVTQDADFANIALLRGRRS